MQKHNLHTHTRYSSGTLLPEILVMHAIDNGIKTLGIADHAYSRRMNSTMQISQKFDEYIQNLEGLKSKGNIRLKIGAEIDFSKRYGADPKSLPFEMLNRLDYVLFEFVNTTFEKWGAVYGRDISELVELRNKITVPVGLAHNDLQKNFLGRDIASVLADNDIFVELNQSEGGRNSRQGMDYFEHFYPELIIMLRSKGVKFVIGTDCHTGSSIADTDKAEMFVEKYELMLHELVL